MRHSSRRLGAWASAIGLAFLSCSSKQEGLGCLSCPSGDFAAPAFRDVTDTDGNVVYCRELETQGASEVLKSMWFSEALGFAAGLCPERAYRGICAYDDLGGSGQPALDRWLLEAKPECEASGGSWSGL